MHEQLELIAALYVNAKEADSRYQELRAAHIKKDLHVVDAGVITRDADGKVRVIEENDLDGRQGRHVGMVFGALLGLALGPKGLIGAAIGTGIGTIAGALTGNAVASAIDTGIKNHTFQQITDVMPPSSSALVVVAAAKYRDSVVRIINAPKAQIKRYSVEMNVGQEIIEKT